MTLRHAWLALAGALALGVPASASGLRPPDPEPLAMKVGEQRIVLGELAEQVLSAQPDRLRTVRLAGLGVHLRALAPGDVSLVWGQPPRLYARVKVEPAVRPAPDPEPPRATPDIQPMIPLRTAVDEGDPFNVGSASRRIRRR